jgi:hypothetical protein
MWCELYSFKMLSTFLFQRKKELPFDHVFSLYLELHTHTVQHIVQSPNLDERTDLSYPREHSEEK